MHLFVNHTTAYTYDTPPRAVTQILRLTPRPHEGQHIVNWRIDTDCDATLRRQEDSYGNIIHVFTAEGEITGLNITVDGEVRTENTNGVVRGTIERIPLPVYLRATSLTDVSPDIAAFTGEATSGKPTLDALHALMAAIHEHMTFDDGASDVSTSATEAFDQAHGVCQDFAHIFIAGARYLKIPARYVGGYMRQNDGRDDYEAGHGWAEAHIPDLGWVAFDPANACCATAAYIRVACGLDYLDASPVRGVRTGGSSESLNVQVRMHEGQAQQ